MGDFNAAPYRGDSGVPHAREGNFTARPAAAPAPPAAPLTRPPRAQAVIGGVWVLLGAQFLRDVVELRPAWKCGQRCRARHMRRR